MGGLLHLVQRGGDWAGQQPAQAPTDSSLYQMQQPTHQRPVNQVRIIRCGTLESKGLNQTIKNTDCTDARIRPTVSDIASVTWMYDLQIMVTMTRLLNEYTGILKSGNQRRRHIYNRVDATLQPNKIRTSSALGSPFTWSAVFLTVFYIYSWNYDCKVDYNVVSSQHFSVINISTIKYSMNRADV